jgi:hypothetical protein
MEELIMTEPTTFKISWSDNEVEVEGRQAAVDFAKAKSLDVSMNVNVESIGDEKTSSVSMTYHGGSLEVYVAETRSPDRRTRKRDRTEGDESTTEGAQEKTSTESKDDSAAEVVAAPAE